MTSHTIDNADTAPFNVDGHLMITDDLDNVYVDQHNAIHPQNMARIIARALARESNSWIHRISFGNGGTVTDAAFQITHKTPNDGQLPDTSGWGSRLYNETYSEIIDDSNPNVTVGIGSAPGDPTSHEHVSGPGVRSSENGLVSDILIEATLNPNEPTGQQSTDNISGTEVTENNFTFDEIGLYTPGRPPSAEPAHHNVDVDTKTVNDATGLSLDTQYKFDIAIDGNVPQTVVFTTSSAGSGVGNEHLYGDLITELNNTLTDVTTSITDPAANVQTFGFLKFETFDTGASAAVSVTQASDSDLFSSLTGFQGFETAVDGRDAGVQNDPVNSEEERERLLSHIVFSPVLKSANRSLKISYTITVSVGRSINPTI